MIAAETVDTPLGGVGEHIFLECGLADALGDVFFFWERLASGFVFHELNAEEETETADVAHVRMTSQRSKLVAKGGRCRSDAFE